MILIAFGSNLPGVTGGSNAALRGAIGLLPGHGVVLEAISGLYETPPVGPGRQGNYVNAVASVSSKHGPAALLTTLARIEILCGRRPGPRWSARVLDLDLLAYGRMVAGWRGDIAALRSGNKAVPRLVIPHPRMDFRPFVLRPMIDIAPHWRHPVSGKPAIKLWNSVRQTRDAKKIVKISGPEWID
jgi:2-amino-4-hydroxy-6-hydroxymethyldihydropteridine diphosphokinase